MGSAVSLEETTKHRIMVVNMGVEPLHLITDQLQENFDVSLVSSTISAWEQLNRAPAPELILLEIISDKGSSQEFCEQLRNSRFLQSIPIIIIGDCHVDMLSEAEAFELGATDVVSLPLVLSNLLPRMKHHATLYRKSRHMESLIYIDPLTHLPNSTRFKQILRQEWYRCARYWHHVSLLLINISNMQSFKQTHGEDDYNALTASIADGLAVVSVRPGDVFASMGDDCLGLLLPDCTKEGAYKKAKQVLDIFNSPNFVVNDETRASQIDCLVAIVTANPGVGGQPNELLSRAEQLIRQSIQHNKSGIVSQ